MLDKRTYINVGTNGTFAPSANHNYDTTPENVDAIINLLRTNNQTEIVLYFHGGLVKDSAGMQSAKIMNDKITESGLHPISFVWETGILDVLKEKLDDIGRKVIFKIIKKIVSKKVIKKLPTTKNRETIKELSYAEVEFELSKKTPFKDFEISLNVFEAQVFGEENEEEIIQNIQNDIEIDVLENPELLEGVDLGYLNEMIYYKGAMEENSLNIENASLFGFFRNLAIIVYKVIKRHRNNTNHEVYATILEEIFRRYYIAELGAYVWQSMKDKAEDMWKPNIGRTGLDLYAGSYLLTKLNVLGSQELPITINAIGHSAGSIAICHLIKEVAEKYPNIKVNNLVFLAPACRSELFHREVVQKRERFNEIRIFTMSDYYEQNDTLIDGFSIVYPHSLLYLISGILEDGGDNPDAHILGLERHINWQNYMKHAHLKSINTYLNETNKNRLVLSVADNDNAGLSSTATDHGDFDNNCKTLKSIVHILKN